MDKLLPCPFCGNKFPFTHITFSCAVLRCKCGAEFQHGSVCVMYKRGEVPKELEPHTYEANALAIRKEDGSLVEYPEHGYVGVELLAALDHAGLLAKWNRRAALSDSTSTG